MLAMVVTDDDERGVASERLRTLQFGRREMEDNYEALLAPLNQTRAIFHKWRTEDRALVQPLETHLQKIIGAYDERRELEAVAAAEKAIEEAPSAADIDTSSVPVPAPPSPGSSKRKDTYTITLTNPRALAKAVHDGLIDPSVITMNEEVIRSQLDFYVQRGIPGVAFKKERGGISFRRT